MNNFFIDNDIKPKQFTVSSESDIISAILNEQNKGLDSNRFFLEYIPQETLDKFDFNDLDSLKSFRDKCFTIDSPFKQMCGCNLKKMNDDIRYYGLKISDPYGNIEGVFDIRNNRITYSPIFPHFYKERDLVKFADNTYFTTMTFEEIMEEQINKASEFYVHIGDYHTIKELIKKGRYVLKKVNKHTMLDFVSNPEEGTKIYKKFLKY